MSISFDECCTVPVCVNSSSLANAIEWKKKPLQQRKLNPCETWKYHMSYTNIRQCNDLEKIRYDNFVIEHLKFCFILNMLQSTILFTCVISKITSVPILVYVSVNNVI